MADLVHRIRAFALKLVGTTAPKQVKGDSTGVQGATRGRLLSWLQIVAVGFGLGVIFYLATTRSVIEFDRIIGRRTAWRDGGERAGVAVDE